MKRGALVAIAALLDAAFGDPPALPHPVRTIGSSIAAGEGLARRIFPSTAGGQRWAGAALTLTIVGSTYGAAAVAARIPGVEALLAASALALRDLLEHVRAVLAALQSGDLAMARVRLADVVGRDTEGLGESEIARAAIETLAESACDGVIAPLLYLTIGGAPAALAYKAVNTLDSMIGHIEEPYQNFGTCAARLDDVANYVPARLTAACIAVAASLLWKEPTQAVATWLREGAKHRSPNAGQVEAAMAGALGVRLGGSNRYDGVQVPGAIFGERFPGPNARDVERAMQVTLLASGIAYIFAVALGVAIDARS
jgi:adenosylcobinamide-phosphate synthase